MSPTCQLERTNDGAYTATGIWDFIVPGEDPNDDKMLTPEQEALLTALTTEAPDQDFIQYGIWLQETPDPIGFDVSVYYSGKRPFPTAEFENIQLYGSATYAGSAAGYFVRENSQGGPIDGGLFSATVNLTVNFDDTGRTLPPEETFFINGSVTNFRDQNGVMIDSGWNLTLNNADIKPTDGFSGVTTGSGPDNSGAWEGRLYGPSFFDREDEVRITINESTPPTGVAGAFNGHFSNGDAMGAFGAHLQSYDRGALE